MACTKATQIRGFLVKFTPTICPIYELSIRTGPQNIGGHVASIKQSLSFVWRSVLTAASLLDANQRSDVVGPLEIGD